MDSAFDQSRPLPFEILWASDAPTQQAILVVLAAAMIALVFVYAPLLLRLSRIALLERAVRAAFRLDALSGELRREAIVVAFLHSPLALHWEEFSSRWQSARVDERSERSPVRLFDVFDQRPLLPTGARRSLLPALPGLFLAIGVLGAFVGLTGAVSEAALGAETAPRAELVGLLTGQIGLALRSSLWGLILAIGTGITGRMIEGSFERYGESLDQWVERAFSSVSAGELANLTATAQRLSLEALGAELTRFTNDLTERLDRGLQRIERSTAAAAGLVSEEQRGVLQRVVRELSLQVQQGVEQHLTTLHDLLERAITHQSAVTSGIDQAFERMGENAQTHARVTQMLERATVSVQEAASSLSGTAHDFTPVLDSLRDTGGALRETANTMRSTQQVVSRSADGVRSSLEHAAAAMSEQREFIAEGLGEIRGTVELMSTGLGENLSRALRGIDDALENSVGRLRATINDSNETIDRMALPVRAAEGTAREMHAALDRVRGEIVGLGEWLGQAIKPLRSTLGQLEDKTGDITRALAEFGDNAHRVDKTMDALRGEIQEESRRFRASTSELGRHLAKASDAVFTLERTAAAAVDSSLGISFEAPAVASPPEIRTSLPARIEAPAAELGPKEAQADPAVAPPAAPAPSAEALATPASPASTTESAGRLLGPDPYARLGLDRLGEGGGDAGASATEPSDAASAGVGTGARPAAAEEVTLSRLLRSRARAEAADAPQADPAATRPADSDPERSVKTKAKTDDDSDEPKPPRTWRFLGKS